MMAMEKFTGEARCLNNYIKKSDDFDKVYKKHFILLCKELGIPKKKIDAPDFEWEKFGRALLKRMKAFNNDRRGDNARKGFDESVQIFDFIVECTDSGVIHGIPISLTKACKMAAEKFGISQGQANSTYYDILKKEEAHTDVVWGITPLKKRPDWAKTKADPRWKKRKRRSPSRH